MAPTLDGNLTVPRTGGANTPLIAMGLDPADPFSAAMWLEPASLDALLLRAPEGAHFLFFSHSSELAGTCAAAPLLTSACCLLLAMYRLPC